uniref:FBA_2 domain-containing protein n=1 Tax=Panagrellus redivivus TaxID=6233 RepID=A0A7E4VNF3_PANRE
MSRPVNLTPSDYLEVYMGPDICPTALLSKINEKTYRSLHISGQYHWTQVIPFLHTGTNVSVCLYDNMDLPEEDMEEFFRTLWNYKINDFSLFNTNCDKTWLDAAYKTSSTMIGTVFKSVEVIKSLYSYFRVTAVTNNDTVMTLLMVDSDIENNEEESDDDELTDDDDII